MSTQNSPTPKIVAAYLRASTEQQDDSPETQRHIIQEWADKHGYVIPADLWFIDVGVSGGKPFNKRPAGGRLMAQVTSKKRSFDTIVVVRLDRLFRNSVDQGVTWEICRKHGCTLTAVRQDLSAETAMDRAMLTMIGALSQAEREITGERIKEKNLSRHQKNLHTSGYPPYGLTVGATSNEPLRIVEDALAAAIRVFEIFAETCGNQNLTARKLNAEGVPPRRGKRWTPVMVRNCVTRPAYRRMAYFDGDLRPKPAIIPETIPPDLVARVDAILISQYGHWHVQFGDGMHSRPIGTYTGLIKCASCGDMMDIKPSRPGEASYFRCRNRQSPECTNATLHAPTIDRLVGECILNELQSLASGYTGPAPRSKRSKRADPTKRLAELADERSMAITLAVRGRDRGGIDMEEFERVTARIDAEIARLTATDSDDQPTPISATVASELAAKWPEFWTDSLTSAPKREMLTAVLGIRRGGIVAGKVRISEKTTRARWTISITGMRIDASIEWVGAVSRGTPWVRGGDIHL